MHSGTLPFRSKETLGILAQGGLQVGCGQWGLNSGPGESNTPYTTLNRYVTANTVFFWTVENHWTFCRPQSEWMEASTFEAFSVGWTGEMCNPSSSRRRLYWNVSGTDEWIVLCIRQCATFMAFYISPVPVDGRLNIIHSNISFNESGSPCIQLWFSPYQTSPHLTQTPLILRD